MVGKALRKTDVSSDSGVIPFPDQTRTSQDYSGSVSGVWRAHEPNPYADIESMKLFLQDTIREATLRAQLELRSIEDNPFDAIYIAKLLQDEIPDGVITKLDSYSNITDLSEEIEFDDGWDD